MDDPEFFGEFLDWGFSNFPAERYGLFFLDHGGSWQGFGGDEQDGLHGSNPIKPRALAELASTIHLVPSARAYMIRPPPPLPDTNAQAHSLRGFC